jgi:biopolymer transport protein ExbD
MRKLGAKNRPSQDVSAASMSDIAFLLLIFFLVTTIFALEEGIPLVLPGKTSTNVKVKRKDIMVIEAHANGAIMIKDETVPMGALRGRIERELAQNEKLIVVIESHPDSEYGLMVDILDELRLANARRISLKTMRI